MKIISSETMRDLDARTIANKRVASLELMERAGKQCSEQIELFCSQLAPHHKKRLIILCGPGNNGGDGFVIARYLTSKFEVKTYCTHKQDKLSPDAKTNSSKVSELCEFEASSQLLNKITEGDIIIDCLFGTGLNRALTGEYETLVNSINASQLPVISVDSPSGLLSDGQVPSAAIKATITLSIGLPKTSYFQNDGPAHVGSLINLDIGFSKDYITQAPSEGQAFFAQDAKKTLQSFTYNSHKYTRGQCLIIAGSELYNGAPIIAADSAAVSGAGMVILAHESLRTPQNPGIICLTKPPDIIKSHFFEKSQSVLIGPGIEINDKNKKLFTHLIKSDKALVIDASAIDLIADNKTLFPRNAPTIITPHAGELQRLAKGLNINHSDLSKAAQHIAQNLSIQVLLKGPQSKIYNEQGAFSYNTSGNWALSTAGSGDALAGIIASLWAKKDINYYEQAQLGCFIHGKSVDFYTGAKRSFTVDLFPSLISKVLHSLSPLA
ncbi:putative YjeF-related sugar kinase [Lentisphaera araneosa HTCC2155]|uniref:Bifunctional NAD(P)H-hydrate repair enzyme n=1 Tax=Lentisphaera araneosa HTCC2155 TaxID=313628 RepID=A6DFZ1_9BACT|nr:bifunctional ADP-dependent NAD(P)H-hydrate dehydratase/NAD(P)H-hydrate epimerase [Lentisphaera araneosa]EDM29721.1 putative YjeF-related sugar kinase [Lentisphaera araneosa HTCC2155]